MSLVTEFISSILRIGTGLFMLYLILRMDSPPLMKYTLRNVLIVLIVYAIGLNINYGLLSASLDSQALSAALFGLAIISNLIILAYPVFEDTQRKNSKSLFRRPKGEVIIFIFNVTYIIIQTTIIRILH